MIWITNEIGSIEDSVVRRFSFSVGFPEFNQRQRVRLWNTILRQNRLKRHFSEHDIGRLAQEYPLSAGVIDLAVKQAVKSGARTRARLHQAITLGLTAHLTLKHGGEAPRARDRVEKAYSLEGLNTSGDVNAMLDQVRRFDHHLRRSDNPVPLNMNLLFYGPPGTGKSELARHVAEILDRTMLCRRASDILDPFVGVSEQNISRMFSEAETSDAVLIVDEVDSLLLSRSVAQRSWEISLINEFLSQMERFRGILIGTTNRLSSLDDASMRRFSHKIGFDFLTPDGTLIFYRRLLQPLISGALPKEACSSLKEIADLAPGDFRVVRDRFCFYPKHELSHELLIDELRAESRIKDLHSRRRRIGF